MRHVDPGRATAYLIPAAPAPRMPESDHRPDPASPEREPNREPEQTYDQTRAQNLEALLVALAERILALRDAGPGAGGERGALLRHAGELTKLIGDVRSELFHYMVRATYDTPEVADSRRIVHEALDAHRESTWHKTEWMPDGDEGPA